MKHLMAIQRDLKANKGQYNSFGKYKYRSAEDILEAVKPLLNREGCVLTLTDEIVPIGERYYVKAQAQLQTPDASFITCAYAREDETKKGMDGSQITGTASSYARKYALNGLFCIDDAKDADTDEHRMVINKSNAEPTRAELMKNVEALMDIKGFNATEILQKARVESFDELADDRLVKLVEWLGEQ